MKETKRIEWFLRIALSVGLLSAVADRFGFWSKDVSAWGNWDSFVSYTQQLNPWIPTSLIGYVAGIATFLEIILGVGLLMTYKTDLIAKATGILLLIFGLSMTVFLNIKAPLDYSVFIASAGAFSLSVLVNNKSK